MILDANNLPANGGDQTHFDDRLLGPDEPAVSLPVFEGPLDLLLYLIRRNEIDIYDIPIETVTKQYLAALRAMEKMNLEVAGEFFVMASTLMYLKSRLLLPKEKRDRDSGQDLEEGEDPRWELVQQLVEYRRFKEASGEIEDLIAFNRDRLPRIVSDRANLGEDPGLENIDQMKLWNAFNKVLRRLSDRLVVGEIEDEPVTVADQMEMLIERLDREPSFTFSSLFGEKISLFTLSATFLAVLELTRLRKMNVRQDESFGEIYCEVQQQTAIVFH